MPPVVAKRLAKKRTLIAGALRVRVTSPEIAAAVLEPRLQSKAPAAGPERGACAPPNPERRRFLRMRRPAWNTTG
jgi:hypothetical protein